MDYVVDDVIRRVAATGASSRHRRRAHVGNRDNVDSTGRMTIFGGVRDGEGGGGIPTVVEAVLRIGGSAMGPALVNEHLTCVGQRILVGTFCDPKFVLPVQNA